MSSFSPDEPAAPPLGRCSPLAAWPLRLAAGDLPCVPCECCLPDARRSGEVSPSRSLWILRRGGWKKTSRTPAGPGVSSAGGGSVLIGARPISAPRGVRWHTDSEAHLQG